MDANLFKDKFNLSNDQYYEVSKEGASRRIRQTFGQLVVEHAYPAQKLQLPFVSSTIDYLATLFTDNVYSLKPACRSRRPGPSIDQPCSSRRISNYTSAKCGRRRRKRTRWERRLQREGMLPRHFGKQTTLVFATRAILYCGNIPSVLCPRSMCGGC